MLKYLLLLVGFVLLIKGADVFVEGSASVAKLLKVPSLIIGLTIVSMGTSAPEAAVSITASVDNSSAIAVSNVVGSNVFNILVVVGACALMKPVLVDNALIKRDIPICIAVTLITLLLALNCTLSRINGIILLVLFVGFMALMIITGIRSKESNQDEDYKVMPAWKSVLFIIGGIAAVIFGGDLVVDNACLIAESFGISETIIGLTIISIGTSLPELVTSIVATKRGQTDIALGNAIGSCIFNVIFILGMASAIHPITFEFNTIIDIAVALAVAVLAFLFTFKSKSISRFEGILFLLGYAGYMVYINLR